MNTHFSIRSIFALILGLVAVAVGCSDANAAESTYLPLYEPCPFADDVAFDLSGESLLLDEYFSAEDADLDGEDLRDDDELFEEEFFSQASPFVGPTPPATPASAPAQQEIATIDLNRASAAQLTELPGIGPALAERIIEYRQARQFTNVAQLQRVKGIGQTTFERLEPFVSVD